MHLDFPQVLHEEWANYGVMHKYQPVDLIRYWFILYCNTKSENCVI